MDDHPSNDPIRTPPLPTEFREGDWLVTPIGVKVFQNGRWQWEQDPKNPASR